MNTDLYRYMSRGFSLRQGGSTLIVSMVLLTLVTLIALTMSRDLFMQEGMTGNTREKIRALNAAESALKQAEWALTQGPTAANFNAAACASGGALTGFIICTQNPVINATTPILGTWNVYAPAGGFTVSAAGGVQNGYFQAPSVYVQQLGSGPITSGSDMIINYRITTAGYGGSQNAVAIVESYFQTRTGSYTLTGGGEPVAVTNRSLDQP